MKKTESMANWNDFVKRVLSGKGKPNKNKKGKEKG